MTVRPTSPRSELDPRRSSSAATSSRATRPRTARVTSASTSPRPRSISTRWSRRARAAAAARRPARRRSSISWSRRGERLALDKNPHMQECLDLVAETNPLPRRVVENLYHTRRTYLSPGTGSGRRSSRTSPTRPSLDGWVSRTDAHGNTRCDPRVPAADGAHARGQRAGGMHRLDRPGRAGQGDQPVQDAVVAIRSPRSRCCARWPRSTRTPCRAVDVGHLLARRRRGDRAHALPAAVLRQDRRVGRRPTRSTTSSGTSDPGIQLVSFDPKSSISMIGREVFASRRDPRRRRRAGRRRHHGVQPGGVSREPLRLSRRRTRRRPRSFCAALRRTSRRRPDVRLGRRPAAAIGHP